MLTFTRTVATVGSDRSEESDMRTAASKRLLAEWSERDAALDREILLRRRFARRLLVAAAVLAGAMALVVALWWAV